MPSQLGALTFIFRAQALIDDAKTNGIIFRFKTSPTLQYEWNQNHGRVPVLVKGFSIW